MLYYGIEIDLERDKLLSEHGRILLKEHYMHEYEESPQHAYARASLAWSTFEGKTDLELAQRLYDACSNGYFMFASPVLSNAPRLDGKKTRGLPISCFGGYVDDHISGLVEHSSELRWLSILGGGVGGHWGSIRSVSDTAPGPIVFLHTVDADMMAYKQGKTRQGAYAAYLEISHPDIEEFIDIRTPTGDANRKCLNLNHGVNISDAFMAAVNDNSKWDLIDPNDKTVRKTVKARDLWEKLLETRYRTGEPYLHFIDTSNKWLNSFQKAKGLKIHGSNLCSEIILPTDSSRTFVCCLSSLNLDTYDQWKDSVLVDDLVTMLDNVLEYFIQNAPNEIAKAKYSAQMERSIGLGVMGFHSYLQQKDIPFESEEARKLNVEIFQKIYYRAKTQSNVLASERTEPADIKGSGFRNAHLLAIAPNANSSIIGNTSPSVEPISSNSFTHRTRVGSFLTINKYLKEIMQKMGKDTPETWSDIIANEGSVQHLNYLTEHQKLVFKTAYELNQEWVVQHAADRQPFIDQAQSINLFFPSNTDRCYVNKVHLDAFNKGLKTLYYLRTKSSASVEKIFKKIERVPISESSECIVCQA